jgi:hypothetical protein
VAIAGADTTIAILPPSVVPNDTVLVVRELNLVKGWNRIVVRQVQSRPHLKGGIWRREDTRLPSWFLTQ